MKIPIAMKIPTIAMSEWTIAAIGVLLIVTAAIVLLMVVVQMRKRGMPANAKRAVQSAWSKTLRIENPTLRILEADKVLDVALSALGYTGTVGEKLKAAGPRFLDKNGIWNAHKLRNTLAHEHGVKLSEAQVRAAMKSFERGLKDLMGSR